MSLKQRLFRFAGQRFFERPAQKLTFQEHVDALRTSGEELRRVLAELPGSERQRQLLRHVIGIERWGQRRLQVFRGEPFVLDGHQPYKPAENASWEELRGEFASTREATLRVAEELNDCSASGLVPHNDFGELSARGWLRYLNGHAEREMKRAK